MNEEQARLDAEINSLAAAEFEATGQDQFNPATIAWNAAEPTWSGNITNTTLVYGTPGNRDGWQATAVRDANTWASKTVEKKVEERVIVDWDEVDLRCKAIEATCKAFGTRQVDLQEFSSLMDQFYTYIKTGKKFIV